MQIRKFANDNALISGHPGRWPRGHTGAWRGILSTLFDNQLDNFKPGMGELDCFCTFVAGSRGKIRGICKYLYISIYDHHKYLYRYLQIPRRIPCIYFEMLHMIWSFSKYIQGILQYQETKIFFPFPLHDLKGKVNRIMCRKQVE